MSRNSSPQPITARRTPVRALVLLVAALALSACQREGSAGLATATPVPAGGVIVQPATPPPPTHTPGPPPAQPTAAQLPELIPTAGRPTVGAPTLVPPSATVQPLPTIFPTVPPWVLTPQPEPQPRPKPPVNPCQPSGCPPPTGCRTYYYTVRPGDNLFRIGLRYGTTATAIARQNGIADVRLIRPGQRLRINVCR